jgi:hypothetical protein
MVDNEKWNTRSELVGLLMGEECRATERKKLMD